MAKFKVIALNEEHEANLAFNYPGEMALIDDRKSFAQFDDDESGFQVSFLGAGFKYDGGVMTGGTIKEIRFSTIEGSDFTEISDFGFDLKAAKIAKILVNDGVDTLLDKVMEHRDVLTGTGFADFLKAGASDDVLNGKGGADQMFGGEGNDTQTGGKGADTFIFSMGDGHDTIKDFTISGDEDQIDNIQIGITEFNHYDFVETKNGDAKVVFEDGSSIVLLGVDFEDRNEVNFTAIG